MIKLVAFDLDGVLVESKETHFIALNNALAEIDHRYVIALHDHLLYFDGLPTMKKLEKLTVDRGLPPSMYEDIWRKKQEHTFNVIKKTVISNENIINLFKKLSDDKIKIYVTSNSIRKTTKLYTIALGLIEYIDGIISNEDVTNPKPNAEMYIKAMYESRCEPGETLIVEDSQVGITAAISSGGHLCRVNNPSEVNISKIYDCIHKLQKTVKNTNKWQGGNMNILIPMAGAGSRFSQAGYTFPKPLIEVNGKPMIQAVVENINIEGKYIYIVRKEHYDKYNLKYMLNMVTPKCEVICVDSLTEGACCTTLLAEKYINDKNPLLIANSDQYVEWDSSEFMYAMTAGNTDGGILTFENTHPKWSYVKVNEYGYVTELAEKKVISNIATVGVYYWSKGEEYVKYAKEMIGKNIRVNNEFYVAPVYNEAIQDGKKIKTHNVRKMWGLGTPEDLNFFLKEKCNGI